MSAVLKHLFPDYSSTEAAWLPSAAGQWGLTLAEFVLGLVLVVRVFNGVEGVAAGILYAIFAVVNVWNLSAGRDTCGCLGSITVSPWVMLTLDVVTVAALVCYLRARGVGFGVRVWQAGVVIGAVLAVVALDWVAGGREGLLATLSGRSVHLASGVIDIGEHSSGEVVPVPLTLCNRGTTAVRVIGWADAPALSRPTGELTEIASRSCGDVPIRVTTKGAGGRRLTRGVLYVECDGRLQELPFAVVWVITGE